LGLCTAVIILVTVVVSILGFRSVEFEQKYIFEPERILAWKEYHRLATSAFLHADVRHLLLNMVTLYLFGSTVELFIGKAHFLFIYFGAVVGGSLLSLYVHRHHDYQAYGASGGVCGIMFAHLLLLPGSSVMMFPLPFSIPGWLWIIGFLVASFYGMKTGLGNVGHDAHLGGAIIGLLITAGIYPQAAWYNFKIFLLVLAVALLLLMYLWLNPLFLPLSCVFDFGSWRGPRKSRQPPAKRESAQVDAILEKVAARGMDSLSEQEKAVLEQVAGKLQRQADSKKPESDLLI